MSSTQTQILDLKTRVKTLEIARVQDHNRLVYLYEKLEDLYKKTIGENEQSTSNIMNSPLDAVEQALQ
jgi:hypothetical protein